MVGVRGEVSPYAQANKIQLSCSTLSHPLRPGDGRSQGQPQSGQVFPRQRQREMYQNTPHTGLTRGLYQSNTLRRLRTSMSGRSTLSLTLHTRQASFDIYPVSDGLSDRITPLALSVTLRLS